MPHLRCLLSFSARLRRLLFACLSLLAAPSASHALSTAPACPPDPVADVATLRTLVQNPQPDRGVLWQVSKGGHTAYLYGSLHVGKLSWNFLGPVVTGALNQSKLLAVELDNSSPTLNNRMQAAIKQASPPNATEEAPLAERLAKQFAQACVAPQLFAGLPAGYGLINLGALSARDEGIFPAFGMEAVLIGFMQATGKEVLALETVEEQAQALAKYMAGHLGEDLAELESGATRESVIQLTTAWANSDLATLQKIVSADTAHRLKPLLDERNGPLAQRIDRLAMSREGLFVAIGVLHMMGDTSVITQLRAKGYTVRQILPPPPG